MLTIFITHRDWGVPKVTIVNILASKVGLAAASGVWPESTDFIVGAIDPEVDAKGHIQPGIGDIGDRLYGTGA
jgi:uracil phosphoribosyltransferase